MKPLLIGLSAVGLLSTAAFAQAPEIIHYNFDAGDATNTAVPGVGNALSVTNVNFQGATICPTGMEANSMGAAQIDSGWMMDLGTASWSIALNFSVSTPTTSFQYLFGSSSAGNFRCFTGAGETVFLGVPVVGNINIPMGAVGLSQNHLVWVYDSSVPEFRTYHNGVAGPVYPQTPGAVSVNGTLPDFNVMDYTGTSVAAGDIVDDFRFYRRAITDVEVTALANCIGGTTFPTFCDPADNNSTGVPSILSGSMGSGVGSGLHLEATQGPPNQFGYFLIGSGVADPGLPLSQGHLCLAVDAGNSIGRYNVSGGALNSLGQIDAAGIFQNAVGTSTTGSGFDVPTTIPTSGGPTIMTGETYHFQFWYREAAGQANFSNGISVTF